ncbi:MAG: hypothetical protein R2865_10880 [Deinococcales bacterium]
MLLRLAQEMVLKVKEPIAAEYGYLRDDLLLFTYLHLAADKASPMPFWIKAQALSLTKPCSYPTDNCPF